MKIALYIISILLFTNCNFKSKEEREIRKSINKYFSKIKMDKNFKKNYDITFYPYSETDYISYLRHENLVNCDSSVEQHYATQQEIKQKAESGILLTLQEQIDDSSRPKNMVYMKIDDSLSKLKPDPQKIYYKVLAYQSQDEDTLWKNTFWLDEKYKIVW